MAPVRCEECLNYTYDDELCEYVCEAQPDMDDAERLSSFGTCTCPFYRVDNEYKIVEKQN